MHRVRASVLATMLAVTGGAAWMGSAGGDAVLDERRADHLWKEVKDDAMEAWKRAKAAGDPDWKVVKAAGTAEWKAVKAAGKAAKAAGKAAGKG